MATPGRLRRRLCPDSNGNGGYSLLAIGTNSVLLRSNVTVTVKLARGRSGSPGTGRSFQLIGCDALNNTNFDLQVFANENQIAGTNGALYWNNNGAYTNWFGTNYSVAGDIRNLSISPTGYNPASLSALTIQCQSNGYIVTLDRLNNGSVTWRSSLLPYNSSATTLSRILVSGGNGAGQWLDDLVVSGVPGSDAVSAVPAAITIQTEDQRQLITDWGYDIKQSGKAAALTPAVAQDLFVTDPDVHPAHSHLRRHRPTRAPGQRHGHWQSLHGYADRHDQCPCGQQQCAAFCQQEARRPGQFPGVGQRRERCFTWSLCRIGGRLPPVPPHQRLHRGRARGG
jgi:hypothetical protein